jgi:hypothetical protein
MALPLGVWSVSTYRTPRPEPRSTRALGQPNGDTNPADGFNGGKYLIWNVRGHVRFTITNLNSNAVLSGVFFA